MPRYSQMTTIPSTGNWKDIKENPSLKWRHLELLVWLPVCCTKWRGWGANWEIILDHHLLSCLSDRKMVPRQGGPELIECKTLCLWTGTKTCDPNIIWCNRISAIRHQGLPRMSCTRNSNISSDDKLLQSLVLPRCLCWLRMTSWINW